MPQSVVGSTTAKAADDRVKIEFLCTQINTQLIKYYLSGFGYEQDGVNIDGCFEASKQRCFKDGRNVKM